MLVEELELDRDEAASDRTERFLLACGVQRSEIAELMRSACAVAERAGSVLLELRVIDGSPEVTLRDDNVALLRIPQARRQAGLWGVAVNAGPALAPDAAIVLGIASTAMPFARTPGDAAERWLRVLRLHGEVGAALQALGVSEGSAPGT